MVKTFVLLLTGCLAALPQTRVDLRSQSKAVDFQSASYTKPFKTGASLPATCSQGELFYLSTAPAGANVFGCTSTNIWTAEGGGITIKSDETAVGSRGALNIVPGAGLLSMVSDSGTQINIQQTADTAVMLTRSGHQSGQTLLCSSNSGSGTTYACAMSPTLTAYQSGAVVNWIPDINGSGGSTFLNVDTLGTRPIKLADGISDPLTKDVVAGRMYALWFDGNSFRMLSPPELITSSSAPPACGAASRGRIWHLFASSGLKDQVSVCAKDAGDQFGWRTLY